MNRRTFLAGTPGVVTLTTTPSAAWLLILLSFLVSPDARASDANRLAYLDAADPYGVGLRFPKLTTPQWVGEEGVEAVVILAIDDMTNNTDKYEAYLRPILDRLKAIDGRAPVSIMTCRVEPNAPQLQSWLKEGLNLEVHTLEHPHPLLQKGNFAEAERNVFGGIDLLASIPGNRPVAFRMPYCDSRNTPSPRFFAEIFNRTTPKGNFLTIDSSVFQLFTPDDPDLPRDLVSDADGRERFRKYLPFPSFVNTVENHPYPYIIGGLCWEFPCMVPSDWEGTNRNGPYSSKTLEDMKAALDATVLKQGVLNLVFHPHGWIQAEQVVELIDHAVSRHGTKVKFLNFREAQDRLDANLLGGEPLRTETGADNGVRLIDLDDDGHLDVSIANARRSETRLWKSKARRWEILAGVGPLRLDASGGRGVTGALFGIIRSGAVSILTHGGAWTFRGDRWESDPDLLHGAFDEGRDRGSRLRDLDRDGRCELIVGNAHQSAVLAWSDERNRWERLPFGLPPDARFVDAEGRDAGLRLVDLDEDGRDDLVWSNEEGYGIFLFDSMETGWSRPVTSGRADDPGAPPMIARNGTNNGAWVHSRALWWQNEDTDSLPDHVDRRLFNDLLKSVEPRAKTPEASLRSIRVRPGFMVELVAAEPLVRDPIAFDWSADGRLWVLEMGDYPLGGDNRGQPDGRVRVLEDTDGDGRYDSSTVFLDNLAFPAGLIVWRKGVLIACAPDILYAEDRDGDGRADARETLFTGFRQGNPQHLINGFDLGLDGWIYGANGDSGGTVRSPKTGATVDISGRDFRFHPDTGAFEAESGQTQYGRHRDDWGNWFGNNNPTWAWQYALADRDLKRNTVTPIGDPRKILEPDTRLFPISPILARFNDPWAAGLVTSANSPTPYRDDLFGPAFEGSLFVSEPVHNLVHRVVLEPDGALLKGRRAAGEEDREFLASSDNWFRPTMLRTGPDGALWIADMYRAVIEHPEWIPDDVEARIDLRAGHDMGRIYRVYPIDRRPRPIPQLDRLDTTGLVAALESPSGWVRDTAQRILQDAHDQAALNPLRRLITTSEHAKARVQALWTLTCLDGLTTEVVLAALRDPHSEVRRHALLVSEGLFQPPATELAKALPRLADDPDPRVRFALAKVIGLWEDPRAGRILALVLRKDASDPWLRAAVLCSAPPHAATILTTMFKESRKEMPPVELIEPLFRLAAARPGAGGFEALWRSATTPARREGGFDPWQFAAAAGLLEAAEKAGITPAPDDRLDALADSAGGVARDEQAAETDRVLALRLLARAERHAKGRHEVVRDLLRPEIPIAVQRAAIEAIARSADPQAADVLLAGWRGYGPGLRSQVLDTLTSREAWTGALMSAIEGGAVGPPEIDAARRRRLLDSPVATIRDRARAVFEAASAGRREVVDRYRAALPEKGRPEAGAAVFRRACSVCHWMKGEGTEVGPDLARLTDLSTEALLVAIFDPNRAFEAKYASYTIQSTDGRVLSGLIASETSGGVTLRGQEGKEELVPRREIEAMAASGQSLMPEGLENDLSPTDVADLIAYIGASGPPRKELPGNRPELVRPGAGRVVTLRPAQAEIYGPSLVLETQYGNLGYWSAPGDRVAWEFELPEGGRFDVHFDYACDNASAGNRYVLTVGSRRIEGQVDGTGSWDDYRDAQAGEVTLAPGRQRLEIRPDGPVRGALIDLRAIELRPSRPSGR